MSGIREEVLIDNDDVTVTRVTVPAGEAHAEPKTRAKRVIVAITNNFNHRHEEDHIGVSVKEEVKRIAGDAVFHEASTHKIVNVSTEEQISLVIELKK